MRFTDMIFQPCCQGCSDTGALLWPSGPECELDVDVDGDYYASVPADTPDIENVDYYVAATSTAFHSFRTRLEARGDFITLAHYVANNPTKAVRKKANRGDAASILDLAMRYGTGCDAQEDLEKSIELLEKILNGAKAARSETKSLANLAPQILQRARSAAALAYFSKSQTKEIAGAHLLAYRHDPDLLRAASEADSAVAAGLPSRAALLVAEHVAALGKKCGMRPRTDERFGKFKALWAAYGSQRKLATNIRERPQQFRCAAADCAVRTMDRRKLKRCSGSCPPETKPSYCSKKCQRRDWQSRHKAEGCVPDSG